MPAAQQKRLPPERDCLPSVKTFLPFFFFLSSHRHSHQSHRGCGVLRLRRLPLWFRHLAFGGKLGGCGSRAGPRGRRDCCCWQKYWHVTVVATSANVIYIHRGGSVWHLVQRHGRQNAFPLKGSRWCAWHQRDGWVQLGICVVIQEWVDWFIFCLVRGLTNWLQAWSVITQLGPHQQVMILVQTSQFIWSIITVYLLKFIIKNFCKGNFDNVFCAFFFVQKRHKYKNVLRFSMWNSLCWLYLHISNLSANICFQFPAKPAASNHYKDCLELTRLTGTLSQPFHTKWDT